MGGRYFAAREAYMRSLGLDPDDDETWALPDSEIGFRQSPRRADDVLEIEAIGDWHPEVSTEGLIVLCVDCLVNPAEDQTEQGLRCIFCEFKRDRRIGRARR